MSYLIGLCIIKKINGNLIVKTLENKRDDHIVLLLASRVNKMFE